MAGSRACSSSCKTPYRSSAVIMSLLNKLQELWLMAVALPHQPPLCHVLLFPTPPLKWPEFMLAVALEFQLIAVALALSLSFPLALIASFAPHSRAPTNKHLASAPFSAKEPFKQLLKTQLGALIPAHAEPQEQPLKCRDHFDTAKVNDSNWTLLPPCFLMSILALNKVNAGQGQILLEKPPTLHQSPK